MIEVGLSLELLILGVSFIEESSMSLESIDSLDNTLNLFVKAQ